MKKAVLVLTFGLLGISSLVMISLPAMACSDYCTTKCSVMPNYEMFQACMYGCCPPAE